MKIVYNYLIHLFVLVYADDTIVLAENEHYLQTSLDKVHEYSTRYNVSVNISIHYCVSRGKVRNFSMFIYWGNTIKIVSAQVTT